MDKADLQLAYDRLQQVGVRLAGGLTDLQQRAIVYHHVYRDSGGNHAFPLLAAHGALWAGGYFRFGFRLARALSWQYAFDRGRRARQMQCLEAFANVFRDINRRVCVDTYANYHFTMLYGDHANAAAVVPPDLLEALNRVHAARRLDRSMTSAEKQFVFKTHFLNEQQYIVGPDIARAVSEFDWPLVKFIALRPIIRFAYFPSRRGLWFRNFADTEERVKKGLSAFAFADCVGWPKVEQALKKYELLPRAFFLEPVEYFTGLRQAILAAG